MLSRRSFVKSLTAAMSAVAAGFPGHSRNNITWEFFTDGWQGVRYQLQDPWSIKDRIYATDGRILISDFGFQDSLEPLDRSLPDLSLLRWDEFNSGGWKPSSTLINGCEAEEAMCPDCMGLERIAKSPEFNFVRDEWGDVTRKIVNGIVCPRCNGDGWVEQEPLIEADGMTYSPGYVARIKTLGDFDYKVIDDGIHDNGHLAAPMLFRFGKSGKGMLMNQMRS